MTTRAARERIAAIRAQSELGNGRSDGHISYNSFLMNFIADLNDKEERAIVAGFKRLRDDARHGVPVRCKNVLLAEGEPTPRHQKHLRKLSKTAERGRNPIVFGSNQKTPRFSRGPTPRTGRSEHSTSSNPRHSTRLLERQFTGRQSQSNFHGNKSSRILHTSRSRRSEISLNSARSSNFRSPRFSDLSSLSLGLESYRSMDSHMTDISIGDIEALTAQQQQLERRIRRINSELAMKATKSPKMKLFSTNHRQSPVLKRSGSQLGAVPGGMLDRRIDLQPSPLKSSRSARTNRSDAHLNPVPMQQKLYLGESIKPVPQTSRSETTKLMKSLASQLM